MYIKNIFRSAILFYMKSPKKHYDVYESQQKSRITKKPSSWSSLTRKGNENGFELTAYYCWRNIQQQ
jgi:hypothetical protein